MKLSNISLLAEVCIAFLLALEISEAYSSLDIFGDLSAKDAEESLNITTSPFGSELNKEWDPTVPYESNVPLDECDTPDQTNFAELKYINLHPPCEETHKKGYCGIRRYQNISFVGKFLAKTHSEQYRLRINLVDVNFGFETSLWPEFSACIPMFNMTCPQESGQMVHGYVHREFPKDMPPISAIIRVRLVSVDGGGEKNVAVCRQFKISIL